MKENNYYTNNSGALKNAIIFIALLSIIICISLYKPLDFLSSILNKLLCDNGLDFLVFIGYGFQPLTFSVVFSVLWVLFDNFVWKIFARVGLLLNINGTWCGILKSNPNEYCPKGKNMFVVMVIKQKFSKISIKCYFSEKRDSCTDSSYSAGYDFNISELNGQRCISFSYANVKRNNRAPENEHFGFNYYYLINNALTGHYVTFRASGRTGGKIELRKINSLVKYTETIWKKENF